MANRGERRASGRTGQVATTSRPEDTTVIRRPRAGDLPLQALFLIVLLVACRPIDTVDLWWELSRGREVAGGEWAPSRSLLAGETLADADWLGGLPIYLVYQLVGASGLMLMRLVAAAAVGWAAWQGIGGRPWRRTLGAGGVLLAASAALDPSALFWDLTGLLVLGQLIGYWHRQPWLCGLVLIACWMMVWANLGPRPLIGLLALIGLAAPQQRNGTPRTWRQYLALLAAATGACVLTPRMAMTLFDSARLLLPGWTVDGAWLSEGSWQPVTARLTHPQLLGFALLSTLILTGRGRGGRGAVVSLSIFALAHLLAWHSVGNMALAAVLMVMAPQRTAVATPASHPQAAPARRAERVWAVTGGAAGASLLAIAVWAQLSTGVGWGLAKDLDIRFLDRALGARQLEGSALADRISTAGMLAWGGRGLVPQDIPHRALLGKRLRDFRLLLNDLRLGHRGAYLRTDGSQGGWWLPLMNRGTALLLVTAEDVQLLEGLEPTLWRPLGIDGPVIPFAKAGDPTWTGTIVEVLRLQDYVEIGDWAYQSPRSTLSEYDRDWWGLRMQFDDTEVALRQAQVFRAMGLPRAALRVLRYLQQTGRASMAEDLAILCHAELMEREIRLAGRPSQFRRLAWEAIGGGPSKRSDNRLALSAAAYVAGDLNEALDELGGDRSPEGRYARAILLLEGAHAEQALRELIALDDERPDEVIGILAGALAAMLEPEGTPIAP